MWKRIAESILRNKTVYLIILGLITVFLSYHATQIQLSYDYVRPLPENDPDYETYENFKKRFGPDGTVMVIGFKSEKMYKLDFFNDWYDLTLNIKKIQGIQNTMSIGTLFNLVKDDSLKKFDLLPLLSAKPKTQAELDSIYKVIGSLNFYKGLIFNPETKSSLMMVTFNSKELNSKQRIAIVHQITDMSEQFAKKHGTQIYFSGMPYIRTHFMEKVSDEMRMLIIMAILATAIILFIVFKSFRVVAYSLVVVIIGMIWSIGTIHLFGFKITILSGMIPPLITVIGLPNCVFIINKYQTELGLHGNKAKALLRSISKVGFSNFLANVTTAIGFFVFFFTKSSLLVEFGLVAAFNVMTTFAVAHILIPIILSFMPMPKPRHLKHLTGKNISGLLKWIDHLVHNKRVTIYISLTILTVIGIYGLTKIKVIGYIVDDLPKRDPIYENLRFFESNFKGVLPLEISIDTKKNNGVFLNNAEVLYKISKLQKEALKYNELTRPLSIVEGIKFSYQAYNSGKAKFYTLPSVLELNKLKAYSGNFSNNSQQLSSFIDSTNQYTRISYQVADVGSVRLRQIENELNKKISEIFPKDKYDVEITGTCSVFVKGNDYLFYHLFISLVIAIVLIIMVGLALFRSVPIILLSKLPCLIPLVVTAGIMGFGGIHFKPSTILVFSIAFGLASDGTIYILAEYWNQLKRKGNTDYSKAISNTINEVGVSMIYTASILFTGMAIFAMSDFGGTVALGVLMSITIAVSLFTNLILLPSILLSLEKRGARKEYLEQAAIFEEDENGEDSTKN
jgi:uncharacterized protein